MKNFHSSFGRKHLSTKRALLSAIHEAGHALPYCYFGGEIVEVMVRSRL
jgi:hypothetical protein